MIKKLESIQNILSSFFVKKGLDKEKMYVIVVVEQIKQQLEQMGKICFMEVYL